MQSTKSAMRNIVLIGYRGSGKSTVGRLIAARLARPHIDTDRLIESRLNRTIAEIFEQEGEAFFREAEAAVISELPADGTVISVGGGAIEDGRNRKRLSEFGYVVWLDAAVEELYRRISADAVSATCRPALSNDDPLTEIRIKLADRTPYYRELADLRVDSANLTPAAVAEKIVDQLPAG